MDIIKRYDAVIVGGSIGGSTAARFAAESGLKTLLVESAKTPREKPCSGIQFKYFEKLIGKKNSKREIMQQLAQKSLYGISRRQIV